MGIEEDIKSKGIPLLQEKVFVNILYTAFYISKEINSVLRKYDLTEAQYNLLRILELKRLNTAKDFIKIRETFRAHNIARVAKKLLAKELITRKISNIDKRLYKNRLTKKGELVLKKINLILDESYNNLIKLTKLELEELSALLYKLRL